MLTGKDAIEYAADQKYNEAPYVLHDDDGTFYMREDRGNTGIWTLGGEKVYINDKGEETKTEIIDRDHMLWLKEEAYDAYGERKWYGGWEPGALVPELPKESEVTDTDNCETCIL